MTIAPAILKHYPDLSNAQREVVAHLDGPLLVVAGPGLGKTYSIVLRALKRYVSGDFLLMESSQHCLHHVINVPDRPSFEQNAAFEHDFFGRLKEVYRSDIGCNLIGKNYLCVETFTTHITTILFVNNRVSTNLYA